MRLLTKTLAVTLWFAGFVGIGVAQEIARQTTPVLVKEVRPIYTKEAREAGIEGIVGVDAVVLKDGTVGDVKINKSLDQKYGLDEQAIKCAKQWLFEPGTKDGQPVDVQVAIEISFRLK